MVPGRSSLQPRYLSRPNEVSIRHATTAMRPGPAALGCAACRPDRSEPRSPLNPETVVQRRRDACRSAAASGRTPGDRRPCRRRHRRPGGMCTTAERQRATQEERARTHLVPPSDCDRRRLIRPVVYWTSSRCLPRGRAALGKDIPWSQLNGQCRLNRRRSLLALRANDDPVAQRRAAVEPGRRKSRRGRLAALTAGSGAEPHLVLQGLLVLDVHFRNGRDLGRCALAGQRLHGRLVVRGGQVRTLVGVDEVLAA
ncbi:hypothetical protein SAMN04515671_0071 [Nakamurella panacisegetis]|uniref:Uncharacterized protein n=1 Tax=Nakamurella panacisegetis TaxID=1090615 RepID=A0A1H0HGZ7_9ACTN|nr:hypothetical protein SAMN04515671_0071 [Nakamurella panacisegetis]